ncbi:hypothetical protein BVG16_10645 [Paenibacillus selenitireducens]|uniref:GGDEF domain-containing protein n=1 Tax=Paenibacillus selenitireducens TaxID=1324314 RepID=A0A1T2XET0_9BACL|nr:EAL domain-containing protein [Paenibacillus selenitireducens]OPA78338.1 hypothetical protein BVG16_10645 [Paenibacillus selenitireducens]
MKNWSVRKRLCICFSTAATMIAIVGLLGILSCYRLQVLAEYSHRSQLQTQDFQEIRMQLRQVNANTLEMILSTDVRHRNALETDSQQRIERIHAIIQKFDYIDFNPEMMEEFTDCNLKLEEYLQKRDVVVAKGNNTLSYQVYEFFLSDIQPLVYQLFDKQDHLGYRLDQITYGTFEANSKSAGTLFVLLSFVLLVTLVSFVYLGRWTYRSIMLSLREVIRGAEQISQGHFNIQLEVQGDHEFQLIGDQFNWMARQIEQIVNGIQEEAEEQIQYLVFHDELTGLPNRRSFNKECHALIEQADSNFQFAVMFMDVDRFKSVNDSLGHAVGDRLLRMISDRLKSCLPEDHFIARWGGDEFTLLLSSKNSQERYEITANKIVNSMKDPLTIDTFDLHVSVSIGIAIYPEDGGDMDTLLRNADQAMYQAKETGKNKYQLYQSNYDQLTRRLKLENDLQCALERKEFYLVYQPQVDISTGRIVGAEALIRWNHSTMGIIPPDEFIPIAEDIGCITAIGEWVMREACTQNVCWIDLGLTPICVSVNLSARQLQQERFVETVCDILAETNLDPNFLRLEITESMMMQNTAASIRTLHKLRGLGVSLAIDDFGKGYSSLSYLKDFPVNVLKIDRSFIQGMTQNDYDKAIVSSIITLAHNLKIKVVAEGAEMIEEVVCLLHYGCDEVQGYSFSKPMLAEDLGELLRIDDPYKAQLEPWTYEPRSVLLVDNK